VLVLHGFGGTPLEVEVVVEVAHSLGLQAEAPLLPGHGSHARQLAACRWGDWYDAAEQVLLRLTADRHRALVAGFSMGALLATHLAALHERRIKALVLLASAFWLPARTSLVLRAAGGLRLPDVCIPKLGPDLADPAARRTHRTYPVQPLHAAIDVERASARCRRLAARIRVPVLIAHGARDRVCPVSNAWRIAARIASRDQRILILPRSRHIITRDVEREILRRELHAFFSRFRPESPSGQQPHVGQDGQDCGDAQPAGQQGGHDQAPEW
jgi:carboxylesterase